MRSSVAGAVIGSIALFTPAIAAALALPVVPAIKDAAFQAEILGAHNAERRLVAVPDLVWSDDLADDAEDWAKELAKTGVLKHSGQRDQGENLWMNGAGRYAPATMIAGWIAEKKNYIPGGAHPDVSKTGNWADVGHYTAIVWSTTTKVGCAVGRGAQADFLVCRYNPPGNVRGYAAYDPAAAKRVADAAAKTPTKPAPIPAAAPAVAAAKPAPGSPVPLPIPKPATVSKGA